MVRRAVILILVMLPTVVRAQERHWEFAVGGEYLVTAYSFRSPHNTWGTSLGATWLQRPTDGECWRRMRRYPSSGVHLDLGIMPHGIAGNRLGVSYVLRTPLLPWLDLDMGLGLAHYTKPRYATGDTANVYITTPVVCLVDLGLVARLGDRSHLALRLLHSSNGNIRRPNRGLNFIHLEMGMALDDGQPRRSGREVFALPKPECPFDPWHEVGAMLSSGLTFSRTMAQSGVFLCYDLSLNYQYHHSPLFGYGATVDLWYNFSHRWQVERYGDPYRLPMYVNAMPFVEFYWGRVSLRGGIGLMVATSGRVVEPVYERLALYYNFGNSYVGVGINAHYGQAEFVEWSYGYRFRL